jgi:hypothetical protein
MHVSTREGSGAEAVKWTDRRLNSGPGLSWFEFLCYYLSARLVGMVRMLKWEIERAV